MAMDVTSLPGGYRLTDDDDLGASEVLARAFGRTRQGYYRNWRRVTHNALSRVTSRKELLQFVRDVEKSVTRVQKSHDQRMRQFLLSCRLSPEVVTLYLQAGLLPRIIQETYRLYLSLLEAFRSAQWDMDITTWKDSYVDQMIRHHASELAHIRTTASDYRMMLLETYVYLRNSYKEKFQDPSFTRALFYNYAKAPTGDVGGDEGGTITKPTNRCSHCRRQNVHSGVTKKDCPLKALSANKAQKAMANLSKAQCKAVIRKVEEALEANSSADVDDVIATARAST